MTITPDRFRFIDILKGTAILFIVYGHIIPGFIPAFTSYVSTFHIPIFFFASGTLYNESKYKNDFKLFLKMRLKGLVLPFIYISIIVATGYFFVENNYLDFLNRLLSAGCGGGYALWFVPVLLFVEIAFHPLSKLNKVCIGIAVLISLILSYISSWYIGYTPYNLLLAFCGIFFYWIGNLYRPMLN